MSDALKTDIAAAKGNLGEIEVGDQKFQITEKPDPLLLSELARTGSGDAEAFGVISEFFEVTLGADQYRAFKKAIRANKADEGVLMSKLQEILEKTMGRPTE